MLSVISLQIIILSECIWPLTLLTIRNPNSYLHCCDLYFNSPIREQKDLHGTFTGKKKWIFHWKKNHFGWNEAFIRTQDYLYEEQESFAPHVITVLICDILVQSCKSESSFPTSQRNRKTYVGFHLIIR